MTLDNKIQKQTMLNKWIMRLEQGVNFLILLRCIPTHVRKPMVATEISGTWFKKTGKEKKWFWLQN
jgi:hypothetical protein